MAPKTDTSSSASLGETNDDSSSSPGSKRRKVEIFFPDPTSEEIQLDEVLEDSPPEEVSSSAIQTNENGYTLSRTAATIPTIVVNQPVQQSSPQKDVPTVPGTGITLQTPEEIAAWIEERKTRWPTQSRVEESLKQKDEQRSKEASFRKMVGDTGERQRTCKFFAKSGKCKNGDKCTFQHTSNGRSEKTLARKRSLFAKVVSFQISLTLASRTRRLRRK